MRQVAWYQICKVKNQMKIKQISAKCIYTKLININKIYFCFFRCHCGEVLKKHVPYEVTPTGKRNFGNLIPMGMLT